jgi:hypothetical protein
MMKELFGIAHIRDDEQEVPNTKRMRVGEEVVPAPPPIAFLSKEDVP